MELRPRETVAAAKTRVQPWLDSIPLPAGTRLALMELDDHDPDTGRTTILGLRTVLLRGPAIVGTGDVSQALAEQIEGNDFLSITLTPDAARRFEEATAEWQKRRIAILIDGAVDSAPVVLSKISRGKIRLTPGANPEERRALVARLADRLTHPAAK
ncbi:hypothetical protein LZC95_33765 [Pendulispora brunnea]|uniref:SecDF P1 head subdomain domain-containing protein n=1 Tax=Pendulispora brunnea TaxID=2905690 RepID=A0ABZ2JY35_9BACT